MFAAGAGWMMLLGEMGQSTLEVDDADNAGVALTGATLASQQGAIMRITLLYTYVLSRRFLKVRG